MPKINSEVRPTFFTYVWSFLKSIFEYLDEQKLLWEHQSSFRPNDSFTNQLLSIVHGLYTASNADPTLEVQGVFLDMSKAFDKVWDERLIFKLRQVSISGEALALINIAFLKQTPPCNT